MTRTLENSAVCSLWLWQSEENFLTEFAVVKIHIHLCKALREIKCDCDVGRATGPVCSVRARGVGGVNRKSVF